MPDDTANTKRFLDRFVNDDPTDLRDYVYQPSLAVLPRERVPAQNELPPVVRDQGTSGRCAGHALANLIDLQRGGDGRCFASVPRDEIVSADMLYQMGAFHDELPAKGLAEDPVKAVASLQARVEGLRSLRSVLKGFFHHGVCLDLPPDAPDGDTSHRWQSDGFRTGLAPLPQVFPTVAQAKAAKGIILGAFYRLQPVLNDYHAAINDTGGILVSAQTHSGWTDPSNGKTEIGLFQLDNLHGTHAFVIVGYTPEGFLVLNSWGETWGGYKGLKGVALWRYSDWAQTVMDGWVLRMGVSAPDAFELTIGEQGWKRTIGLIRGAEPRCSQLLGHYLHLDDGFHVEHGAFPSDGSSWPVTLAHLKGVFDASAKLAGQDDPARQERKGIMLWIPGSVEGLADAARAAVNRNAKARALGLYPYSFFWSHLFADKSIEVLTSVFDSCLARIGSEGPELNALIEQTLRGLGRAIWRDIEIGAQRSVWGPGELPKEGQRKRQQAANGHFLGPFRDMLTLATETGCELHLVTEGAGVLVLHELLSADPKLLQPSIERLTTLSLIHPAIDLMRADDQILPLVAGLNGKARSGADETPPARIFQSSAALEARTSFGHYHGSILQLVSRAFEDRHQITGRPLRDASGHPRLKMHPDHPPRTLLGMPAARRKVRGQNTGTFFALDTVKDTRHQTGRVPHVIIRDDPTIFEAILSSVTAHRATKPEH